jgi:hypothetical protein
MPLAGESDATRRLTGLNDQEPLRVPVLTIRSKKSFLRRFDSIAQSDYLFAIVFLLTTAPA